MDAEDGSVLFAHVGEEVVVTVSGDLEPSEPRIVQVKRGDDVRIIKLFDGTVFCKGEGLTVAADGTWHFIRCVEAARQGEPRTAAAQIVSGSSPRPVKVALPEGWIQALLPVPSEEVEAVALAIDRVAENQVTAHLISSTSTIELGQFYRSDEVMMGRMRWEALRLNAERVALVSLESEPFSEKSIVTMRIFGTDPRVLVLPLPPLAFQVITATVERSSGRVAVIALAKGGGIWSLIVETESEMLVSEPKQLSDELARVPDPGIRLTTAGERFVAAWIRESDGAVRISEFASALALPPVTAGHSSVGHLLEVREREETILIMWQDGKIIFRELPVPPTGQILAEQLWAKLVAARELFSSRFRMQADP